MLLHPTYETGSITIGDFKLESGELLPDVRLAFERAGPEDAPVILVCHALTGNQYTIGDKNHPGWWNGLIFDGGYVDTTVYQVMTFNVLGGCNGSTGPTAVNPQTEKEYGSQFPFITIRDIVHSQFIALRKMGIKRLKAVIGGSLGGMQVLEWGIQHSDFMDLLFPLAVTPVLNDYGIAFNHLSRTAILNDPDWQEGSYSKERSPEKGLALARMIGMLTYRTDTLFSERFNRNECGEFDGLHDQAQFEIESYLNYQGTKLTSRFDANCYLYLLKSMDLHDIGKGRGSWQNAVRSIRAPIVAVGYSNDLIYPPEQLQQFVLACEAENKQADFYEVETKFGHDGFLVEFEKWGFIIRNHLIKTDLIRNHNENDKLTIEGVE